MFKKWSPQSAGQISRSAYVCSSHSACARNVLLIYGTVGAVRFVSGSVSCLPTLRDCSGQRPPPLSNWIRLPHAVLGLQAATPCHIARGYRWGRPPGASAIQSDDRSMIHSAWGRLTQFFKPSELLLKLGGFICSTYRSATEKRWPALCCALRMPRMVVVCFSRCSERKCVLVRWVVFPPRMDTTRSHRLVQELQIFTQYRQRSSANLAAS